MARIMTLGEIVVEIMAAKRNQRFTTPGDLRGPYPSGAPAIFIDQVAKLGVAAGLIGCVGDDDFGRMTVDRLAADGVDMGHIRVDATETTGSAFVTYDDAGHRDFIYNIKNAACAGLEPAYVDATALAGCTLLHVTGTSLFSASMIAATLKAVDIVKANGGQVSFDPNVRKEMLAIGEMRDGLRSVFARADIVLPSDGELTALTDAETEAEAIAESLAGGAREVVIKRGRLGCSYYSADRCLHEPGLDVVEVDPTGAGDCFAAAYVGLRAAGTEVEPALAYANAAGAGATQVIGPMEGTAGLDELEARLQSHREQVRR